MREIRPVRRGRMAAAGDWRRQYQALRMTAAQAAALIEGDVIAMTSAANWPYAVDAALAARLRENGGHVEINSLFAPLDTALLAAENVDLVDYYSNFFSGERLLASHGNIGFVPTHLSATAAGWPPAARGRPSSPARRRTRTAG